ncbi:hypothetical protein FQN54_006686 [Arachnomyces sp. PD_36]|nr:hypothetical protein FQN54_006686 [Arachnomyces sp. PD_36]
MLFSRTFAASAAAVFVACFSQVSGADEDYPEWHPPVPGDVRGPCLTLNTLANHGFLPRNGKGFRLPILMEGISKGLNVGHDMTIPHDESIEHDTSLSRDNYDLGDNHSFDPDIWNSVLAYFEDAETVSFTAAAKARFNRVKVQSKRTPNFTYSAKNMLISYTETAQYLSVFGNPIAGQPPVEYLKVFFEEERLPWAEGWRPAELPTTLTSVVGMTVALIAAGGEILPQGLEVTENTIGKVLAGKPIEGTIGNIPL